MLVKPCDCLVESLFHGKALDLLGRVAPDSKAVRHAREEIYLVGVARVFQNHFGFVAFLGREDSIGLSSGY